LGKQAGNKQRVLGIRSQCHHVPAAAGVGGHRVDITDGAQTQVSKAVATVLFQVDGYAATVKPALQLQQRLHEARVG